MAAPVVHFEIHANDPDRARAFYGDVFGWTSNDVPGMEQGYWLLDTGKGDGPGIQGGMLVRRGPAPQEGQPVNAFVCIISVEDLDATHAAVTEAGGTIAMPPFEVPGVGRVFYGRDPEGNLFGAMEPA